jgi:hypothetical protein
MVEGLHDSAFVLLSKMIDDDEALMKAATLKPRCLVKMSDTRWNVLYAVLRRFRALNPALRLLYEKINQVAIDNSKVRFTDICFVIRHCTFPSLPAILIQRQSFRVYWEKIEDTENWKEMEELEFVLMRLQSIVSSCQAEKVPTFSSIPIWLLQILKIMKVYSEDSESVVKYKTLTTEVCCLIHAYDDLCLFNFSPLYR